MLLLLLFLLLSSFAAGSSSDNCLLLDEAEGRSSLLTQQQRQQQQEEGQQRSCNKSRSTKIKNKIRELLSSSKIMKRKHDETSTTSSDAAAAPAPVSSCDNGGSSSSSYGRSKILLLGDSLTQLSFEGWGSQLANRYQRRADVLNRGMSGYNTRWYLKYAADSSSGVWTEPGNVVLVTIFFGANDAALPDKGSKRQHVPIPEYRANLESLIDKASESYPKAKIVLISPPPVYPEQRLEYQKKRYGDKATGILERTSEYTSKYADACKEIASEKNVPIVDLFTAMTTNVEKSVTHNLGKFFNDGLHFSNIGHTFLYNELCSTIQTDCPALKVEPDPITDQFNNVASKCVGIPSDGPYHDEIDADHEWSK